MTDNDFQGEDKKASDFRCPIHGLNNCSCSEPVLNITDENVKTPLVSIGWICPKCGRGVAPWVDTCPCIIKDRFYNNNLWAKHGRVYR